MGAHGGQGLGALAELVQHLALHLGPDQRLVGMLAVDVDQGFSQRLQEAGGDGRPVDPGPRPAVRFHMARDDALALFRGDALGFEEAERFLSPRQVEYRCTR